MNNKREGLQFVPWLPSGSLKTIHKTHFGALYGHIKHALNTGPVHLHDRTICSINGNGDAPSIIHLNTVCVRFDPAEPSPSRSPAQATVKSIWPSISNLIIWGTKTTSGVNQDLLVWGEPEYSLSWSTHAAAEQLEHLDSGYWNPAAGGTGHNRETSKSSC